MLSESCQTIEGHPLNAFHWHIWEYGRLLLVEKTDANMLIVLLCVT